MDEKVVLPKNIGKVIKTLRQQGYSDFYLTNIVLGHKYASLDDAIGLGKLYDKFMKFKNDKENKKILFDAITKGYTVEPEYISNKEAIDAYVDGKKVRCMFKSFADPDVTLQYDFHKDKPEEKNSGLSWYLLTEGKWTVVDS